MITCYPRETLIFYTLGDDRRQYEARNSPSRLRGQPQMLHFAGIEPTSKVLLTSR